jgi:hypothetical protein
MATVAQMPSQHDIHPLLRHPRPITRDSAKAQRMLGLIADSEEKLTGLHREKSKTTKWLERPLYAHLDVSDIESEKEEDQENANSKHARKTGDGDEDADLLEQWINPDRSTSFSSECAVQPAMEPKTKLDVPFNKRRPQPLTALRPISYNPQHLLSPEWTVSPATMSPHDRHQRPLSIQPNESNKHRNSFSSSTSSDSIPRYIHPQTWPVPVPQQRQDDHTRRPVSYQAAHSTSRQGVCSPLGSPQLNEPRPRPTSFATYQHRDRRNSKIASSRGLRNNSYPNFSRPISDIAPKAVPGENIESDAVYSRFYDNEVGPPTPSPFRTALEELQSNDTKIKDEKKSRNRWSTIPQTFMKFTTRRSTTANQDSKLETKLDDLGRENLTEENLVWHESESEKGHTPGALNSSTLGGSLLPTPSYSPLEFKHPLFQGGLPPPFAPWADVPPSPASTQDKRRGSHTSLSPTRKRTQSRLSVESIMQERPESMHSRHSSFGMPSPRSHIPPPTVAMGVPTSPRPISRRGTPSLERTCILCKTTKEPSALVNRRITSNCWHEPATCFQCLQSHVERCVTRKGWEHCTCPECGEHMTYDDIGAFADDDKLVKWDD